MGLGGRVNGLGGYEVKKLLLFKFLIKQGRAEGPMEHIAQGKRSDTLGIACWSSRAL